QYRRTTQYPDTPLHYALTIEVTMPQNRRSALRPLPNIRDQRRDGFGNSSARFSRRQVFYFHRRAAFHAAQNRRVLKFVGRREREDRKGTRLNCSHSRVSYCSF